MSPEHQAHLDKLRVEVSAFRRELTKESDRGCALFAGAYLDKAVSDLLWVTVVFTDPKKMEKELFDQNGPIGSFSARIKMAYYLGRISKVARRDLDLIRDIRNHFAHHPAVASFDDESIANKCRELGFSFRERHDKPRLHFLGAVFGVLAQVHGATMTVAGLEAKADDAPTEEEKARHRAKIEAGQTDD